MQRDVGDVLRDWGVVTPEVLAHAREMQASSGRDLGEILIELRVDSLGVYAAWADLLEMEFIDLEPAVIDPAVARLVPEATARQYSSFPSEETATCWCWQSATPPTALERRPHVLQLGVRPCGCC